MGVQRKTAQINWLTSFGLIIFAGTFYRVRKINNTIFKAKINDLMQKIGLIFYLNHPKTILSSKSFQKKGQWEKTKLMSSQYRQIQRFFNYIERIDYFYKNKSNINK